MSSVLEEKITASLVNGGLPCPAAWEVAGEANISRRAMGEELNRLKIRVYDCQLGCFGTKKATHEELVGKQENPLIVEKIGTSLLDGHLPCPVAFKIADTLRVTPMEVGDAATMQKIKMNKCQLGCFP